MSRESRASSIQSTETAVSATRETPAKPPWQAGFSETSGERNKLCVSQIRSPVFRVEKTEDGAATGALFAIIDGGLNNELPQHLASKLPDILRAEKRHESTSDEYMKYTLLKAHQSLQTSGQKMGASCTLCHIEKVSGTSPKEEHGKKNTNYVLRVANSGHTEAVLCRKGRALPLTKRFLVEDASVEEMERIKKAGAIVTEVNGFSVGL